MNEVQRRIELLQQNGVADASIIINHHPPPPHHHHQPKNPNIPPPSPIMNSNNNPMGMRNEKGQYVTTLSFGGSTETVSNSPSNNSSSFVSPPSSSESSPPGPTVINVPGDGRRDQFVVTPHKSISYDTENGDHPQHQPTLEYRKVLTHKDAPVNNHIIFTSSSLDYSPTSNNRHHFQYPQAENGVYHGGNNQGGPRYKNHQSFLHDPVQSSPTNHHQHQTLPRYYACNADSLSHNSAAGPVFRGRSQQPKSLFQSNESSQLADQNRSRSTDTNQSIHRESSLESLRSPSYYEEEASVVRRIPRQSSVAAATGDSDGRGRRRLFESGPRAKLMSNEFNERRRRTFGQYQNEKKKKHHSSLTNIYWTPPETFGQLKSQRKPDDFFLPQQALYHNNNRYQSHDQLFHDHEDNNQDENVASSEGCSFPGSQTHGHSRSSEDLLSQSAAEDGCSNNISYLKTLLVPIKDEKGEKRPGTNITRQVLDDFKQISKPGEDLHFNNHNNKSSRSTKSSYIVKSIISTSSSPAAARLTTNSSPTTRTSSNPTIANNPYSDDNEYSSPLNREDCNSKSTEAGGRDHRHESAYETGEGDDNGSEVLMTSRPQGSHSVKETKSLFENIKKSSTTITTTKTKPMNKPLPSTNWLSSPDKQQTTEQMTINKSVLPGTTTNGKTIPTRPRMIANETQTEVLPRNGFATLMEKGNLKANMQLLIAELDAAKDLNRKLSTNLSVCERDLESLRIKQSLQHDENSALVAAKIATYVRQNRPTQQLTAGDNTTSSSSDYTRSKSSIGFVVQNQWAENNYQTKKLSQCSREVQTSENTSQDQINDLEAALNRLDQRRSVSSSSSEDQTPNQCRLLLEYVRKHGHLIDEDKSSAENREKENAKIKSLESEKTKLEQTLLEGQENERSLQNMIRKLNMDLDTGKIEIRNVQLQAKTTEETKSKLEKEIEEIKSQNQKLSQRLQDSSSDERKQLLRTKHIEINELNRKISQLETTLNETRKDLKDAKTESAELTLKAEQGRQKEGVQSKDVNGSRREQEEKLGELEREKRELNAQLERELTDKQELFTQINSLLAKVADLEKEESSKSEEAESEINQLRREKSNLETELSNAEREIDRSRTALSDKTAELEAALIKSRSENESLTKRFHHLTEESHNTKNSSTRVHDLEDRVKELEREKQEAMDLVARLKSETSELDKVRFERDGLKTQLEDVLNSTARSGGGNFDQEDETIRLESEKRLAEHELDRVRGRLEQIESKFEHELYDLGSKYRQADEDRFKLQEDVQILERKLDQLKEGHKENGNIQSKIVPMDTKINKTDADRLVDENEKLKAEIEKQQRLVNVLRRKINSPR